MSFASLISRIIALQPTWLLMHTTFKPTSARLYVDLAQLQIDAQTALLITGLLKPVAPGYLLVKPIPLVAHVQIVAGAIRHAAGGIVS